MKKFFILILCLLLSGQVLSQYRGSGGTASFKVVSDTTSNVTSAGRTFWFGSQPWIHDGTYYKLLNYSTPNGVMEGYSYRLGRATGTNGQILALATESTPDSTYWTTYTPDAGALLTRNTGAEYTYMTNLTDNFGIGLNNPINKLHVYKAGMAWNVPTTVRIKGSSGYYNNNLALGDYRYLESFCRGWNGFGGDEYHIRLSCGGKTQNVTGSADSILVENHYIDYIGFDLNRKSGYGWRFLKQEGSSASSQKVQSIARIDWNTGYFFVGDTTTADKDWRMYVGDDAAWARYFGFDDGNSEWNLEGANYTYNVGGGAYNWRAAGDTNPNLLTTIGSTDRVGVNTSAPDKKVEINSADGTCLRLTYNDANGSAANYSDFAVSSSGGLTITPSGGDANFASDVGITSKNLNLTTTTTTAIGVIKKGADAWLHDFHHPTGSTATPGGLNIWLGGAGNFTTGSTATSNLHASNNVGIGSTALVSNVLGSYNLACGVGAGYSNTDGNHNTCYGVSALRMNTIGGNNIAIGSQAGRYHATGSTPLVSPENSIYIGYESRGKDDDDNNSIVIGYQAIGMGANSVVLGNTNITKTYLRASVGINDVSIAGTYDLEVGDSVQVGGNLLIGSYAGAWSRIKPGEGGVTSSSTQDIKLVGPEKNIVNILDLAKQVQVREWRFDSSKVYEKFVQPAGFDTLAKFAQDSIRELHEKSAKAKANELAKKKHYTPVAENWNIVGQHFGGNSKEINSEQVMWAQFQMIQALLKRVEVLEAENKDIKVRLEKLENPK